VGRASTMNERIQELFNQALVEVRVSIDPPTLKEYPDPNGLHTKIEFSAEKFAELLVKECWTTISPFIEDDNLAEDALAELKEQFGVEE
jgi:hypothetical protein